MTEPPAVRTTHIHLPEAQYLLLVGQMAYMVTSIEGLILWDLPGLAQYVPEKLNPTALANQTTGAIGAKLTDMSTQIEDVEVRAYIAAGGEVLTAAARARNALLHSRPATDTEERTRLSRWSDGGAVAFWISDEWLNEQIDALSVGAARLNALRPIHKNTSFGP